MATGTELNDFFDKATGIIGAAVNHAMKDGTLAAAGRLGIDELGMALKAFPDAIQAQESGTIFNPTQGEIAAARDDGGVYGKSSMASPSEIASARDDGSVHGKQALPSPSEIAADDRPYQPEPDHGREQALGR